MSVPVLYILDVGHGNSSVLMDSGTVIVFDAGPRTSLLEFLRQEGIERVDAVLISHADKDHVEGLVSLIESNTVSIGKVRLNTDLVKKTALWSDLIYLLDRQDHEGKIDFDVVLTTKNSGEFSSANVNVEILAPSLAVAGAGVGTRRSGKRALTTNGISAVVRLVVAGIPKVLLCGDMNADGLAAIRERIPNPEASVVIYPHHGGRSDGGDDIKFARDLLEATSAKTVVFSIGRGLYGTPIPAVVDEIRQNVPDLRIACTQLSEHCAANVPKESPPHLAELFSSGRERGHCCAGTITVLLNSSDDMVSPSVNSHLGFIDQNASGALCRKGYCPS